MPSRKEKKRTDDSVSNQFLDDLEKGVSIFTEDLRLGDIIPLHMGGGYRLGEPLSRTLIRDDDPEEERWPS